MKNTILVWGGFLIISICFYIHFGVLFNTKNDSYWKDRQYVLTEKIEDAHEYKGRIKEDHYIKYYYVDDPSTIWTSQVSGVEYHSKTENQTYTKRTPKDEDKLDRLNWWTIIICFFGMIIMSVGITNSID